MDIAGIGSSSEVLAVLGSGPPAYTGGKLLGIQLIQNSTRIVQAQISFDLLKSWNLTQNITGLVFDIKCNSGVHKGAANILEDVLQKYVFCLACRASHIGNCNWSCLGKLKAQKTPGSRNFEMFSRIFQKTIKQLLA